ncbi:Carboxypeptidase Y, partial [Hortaea werneckii]
MKVAASALLIGAATAAVPQQQQPLQAPEAVNNVLKSAGEKASAWTKPLKNLQHELKHLTEEARQTWDEVALMFPEAMDHANFISTPKKHTRKHDTEWDFITSGKATQDIWVTNKDGEKERELDGNLEAFNLRTKKVDPKSLGVDKVKQYSGYLDNEEDDKHLFYW